MDRPMLFELPNRFGLGDGSPLYLELRPNLAAIFGGDDPPAPFRSADDYWRGASRAEKRTTLGIAYCEHVLPEVRLQTIALLRNEPSRGMAQVLVNLLTDEDERVRDAAAETLWAWDPQACRLAVLCLRDEIRGHTAMGITAGLWLGREEGVRALDFLVGKAPTEEQRRAIEKTIAEESILIEDRIRDVDTRSVRFVGKEQNGQNTYEVYRAKNKQQALAFLKTKSVTLPFYYIEVETMEGNVGRDIEGIYEI